MCLFCAGAPGDAGVPGSVGSIGPKGEIIEYNPLSLFSHLDKKNYFPSKYHSKFLNKLFCLFTLFIILLSTVLQSILLIISSPYSINNM